MRYFIFVVSTLFLWGCGPSTKNVSVVAPASIAESFSVSASIQPGPNKHVLTLKKASLEKEFLLHAQIIVMQDVPQFNGLKSRVVSFRQRGQMLYLLEATDGHMVTNELPANLLLAEFPIVKETDDSIDFDFNLGMKRLYVAGDWRASDFDGVTPNSEAEFAAVNIPISYIEEAYLSARNELVVRQVARAESGGSGIPLEARYYFSPYAANNEFKPTESKGFDRMGFFEVAPRHVDGNAVRYASKFFTRENKNEDTQIIYAVSANTPAEQLSAVKEGVLYWNKAFGYEKIKVITAPEGVTAPNPDYNLIQWVTWDQAGMAYADSQMDPRTGEIRHAQVFMTSVFAVRNKWRARQALRRLKASASQPMQMFSLKGFASSRLCNFEATHILESALETIATNNLSEEQILKIANDAVREVVAHEVGHTLGLRHNFAGNLGASFSASELGSHFGAYVKNAATPAGVVTSSSSMEYQAFESTVMSGDSMLRNPEALEYDKKAIRTLYLGEQYKNSELPLFCTDSHNNRFLGCVQWDQGNSPLDSYNYLSASALDRTARGVVESFIAQMTTPGNRLSASEVSVDPAALLTTILAPRGAMLGAMTKEVRDLKTHRSFERVDRSNELNVEEKQVAAVGKEFARLGGITKLFARLPDNLAANWLAEVKKLLASPEYQSGTGLDGKPYSLSANDVAALTTTAEEIFSRAESLLPEADLKVFTSMTGTLLDHPMTEDLASLLLTRASEYLLTESGDTLTDKVSFPDGKVIEVRLPVFKYSQDVRLIASSLFVGRQARAIDWGFSEHATLKSLFQEKTKTSLGGNDLDKADMKNVNRPTRVWLLQNKALNVKLNAR